MNEITQMIENINNIGKYQLYDLPYNRQLYVNKGVVKIIEHDKSNNYNYISNLENNIILGHATQDAWYSDMLNNDMWQEMGLNEPFAWNTNHSIQMDINGFNMLGYNANDYGYLVIDNEGMYVMVPILYVDDYKELLQHQNDFVGIIPNVGKEGVLALIRTKIALYRGKKEKTK